MSRFRWAYKYEKSEIDMDKEKYEQQIDTTAW